MDQRHKHKVSLRGASAGEISRDDLLTKVSQERELRSYVRRANAAALYIQRVWRRYIVTKRVALQLQGEWESLLNCRVDLMAGNWISSSMLRPFLFFVRILSIRRGNIQAKDIECMQICFKILLESMNSTDPELNFCSLAVGTLDERSTWTYQTRELIFLCSFLLTEGNKSDERSKDVIILMSLALRIVVVLTDPKGWKSITYGCRKDADTAARTIVQFLIDRKSGYYTAIGRYIHTLPKNSVKQSEDKFFVTTSAITLALRPFHMTDVDIIYPGKLGMSSAIGEYVSSVLTIPWLVQRLPAVLIPALKHKTVLLPCFQVLLISGDQILAKMLGIDPLKRQHTSKVIPPVGWALANIICLATGSENDFVDQQGSNEDRFYMSYVRGVITLAESFLGWLENIGNQDVRVNSETSSDESEATDNSVKISYVELFRPLCQQWHLEKLLAVSRKDLTNVSADKGILLSDQEGSGKLELFHIAHLYSCMLRIYAVLNPLVGPLPVLNMLSFSPGYLVSLWNTLESTVLPLKGEGTFPIKLKSSGSKNEGICARKHKQLNKWVNVLNKFASKPPSGHDYMNVAYDQPVASQVNEESSDDVWDIEPLRRGPQGISKDISCLLHLFCATYSHLLFVLDDIEFYEKQVPFLLEQQRRIASVLNTLVYNGLLHGVGPENRPLMDSAIRCLHLIYERDCRHPFSPPVLWLSPGRTSRPPIAVAARTHEVASANNMRSDDALCYPTMGSVITITPHVFPFEERVQIFREFISMDKVSRKMAGEVDGRGSRSIEIVVRRGHVVEDGFQQLNSLGTKLKSSIHVSFVNESGLPEAGLDYGGLSKEFLTDISKAAFAPQYGLFCQTSTSDRLLVPNPSARNLENGIQMIEFLGRVVGKALYEGILLDYSFSHVFVQKLLGRYSFLDELSTLDPELYRNLMYVKHYDGDVKELSLDFTVIEESFGRRFVIELKHGGKDISVTNENKMQYIHAMADYKLNRQILPFSNAFYRGLTDLISPSWLRLFNAREFNQLLSGGNHDIDVDDLRNNTKYTGGYSENSRTVKIFWEVMKGFEPKERCMLLKFVTSCSRAPLLGFKYLQPTFTIHKVACDTSLWAAIGGQDVDRLPSASTCYNTLKLPTYKRANTMREKLLYAISSNAGFELS